MNNSPPPLPNGFRYLAVMFGTCLLILATIVGFNWIVDPYGILPDHPFRLSLRSRPQIQSNEFVHKAYALWQAKPRTAFFGSSRVCIGLPMDHPGLAQPAYNCGLGGAHIGETTAYLRHALARGTLRTVFIGLDPQVFGEQERPFHEIVEPAILVEEEGKKMPSAFFSRSFFSLGTFKSSWKTVMDSPGNPIVQYSRGSRDESITRAEIQNDSVAAATQYLKRMKREKKISETEPDISEAYLSRVREMARLCRARGVRAIFFIHPMNGLFIKERISAEHWQSIERAKTKLARALAEELPPEQAFLYDFCTLNALAQELHFENENSRVWKYWWEASHYRTSYGRLMLNVMTGVDNSSGELPENFVALVYPDRKVLLDANGKEPSIK